MSVVGSYQITLEDEYSSVAVVAEVILFDEKNKRIFHGEVTDTGTVVFNNVPAGEYTLVVVKEGYKHYKTTLTITSDVTIDVVLEKI